METNIYKNPKVYSKVWQIMLFSLLSEKYRTSNCFIKTPQVTSITGVKIVNYCSPLYFANAEIFRQRVIKKVQLTINLLCLNEWVLTQACLCLDRTGSWQTYSGQAEVLRERAKRKSEGGEEGQGGTEEETQLFG